MTCYSNSTGQVVPYPQSSCTPANGCVWRTDTFEKYRPFCIIRGNGIDGEIKTKKECEDHNGFWVDPEAAEKVVRGEMGRKRKKTKEPARGKTKKRARAETKKPARGKTKKGPRG
jgi:hypothetical protein